MPHAQIREACDRAWTRRLIGALAHAADDDLERIATTLVHLEDPRAVGPLTALLDSAAPVRVRAVAAGILRGIGAAPSDAQLRAWWRGADPLCRHHALLSMGRGQADLVGAVADDPAHALHRDAIDVMEFGFEEAHHQARKIAALDHPDPEVRATAATILAWDEPLAAEPALIRCAAADVPEVAAAAAQALGYFGSRAALRCLGELRPEVSDRVADGPQRLAEVAAGIAAEIHGLPAHARGRLLSWLHPVWDLVADAIAAFTPVAPAPPAVTFAASARRWTADELVATYADLDGAWAERIAKFPAVAGTAGWSAADHRRAGLLLANHADPAVRERAAPLLAAWGARDLLVAMLRDDASVVRKAAAYACAALPADPALAPILWQHLHDPATGGTQASETLASWAVHAPAPATGALRALVESDPRESVQVRAIDELVRRSSRPELAALVPRLARPPTVTWAVHVAILAGCAALDVAPGSVAALDDCDALAVQLALARLGC